LAANLPRLCTDPPGFDRTAFHRDLRASVVGFFRGHLAGDGGGMDKKALRCSHFLLSRPQVICPTGGVRKFLSSPLVENILLLFFRIMW